LGLGGGAIPVRLVACLLGGRDGDVIRGCDLAQLGNSLLEAL
jgi:hypothetical protein